MKFDSVLDLNIYLWPHFRYSASLHPHHSVSLGSDRCWFSVYPCWQSIISRADINKVSQAFLFNVTVAKKQETKKECRKQINDKCRQAGRQAGKLNIWRKEWRLETCQNEMIFDQATYLILDIVVVVDAYVKICSTQSRCTAGDLLTIWRTRTLSETERINDYYISGYSLSNR